MIFHRQNPKPEIQRPKDGRDPKPEGREASFNQARSLPAGGLAKPEHFWISDFGFQISDLFRRSASGSGISSFGFRASTFGFGL